MSKLLEDYVKFNSYLNEVFEDVCPPFCIKLLPSKIDYRNSHKCLDRCVAYRISVEDSDEKLFELFSVNWDYTGTVSSGVYKAYDKELLEAIVDCRQKLDGLSLQSCLRHEFRHIRSKGCSSLLGPKLNTLEGWVANTEEDGNSIAVLSLLKYCEESEKGMYCAHFIEV